MPWKTGTAPFDEKCSDPSSSYCFDHAYAASSGTEQSKPVTDGPGSRTGYAGVTLNDVPTMFGGYGDDGYANDTWTWNGASWTRIATAGPSPRTATAMAGNALAHSSTVPAAAKVAGLVFMAPVSPGHRLRSSYKNPGD